MRALKAITGILLATLVVVAGYKFGTAMVAHSSPQKQIERAIEAERQR
jgi:hypothetical protein